MPLLVDTSRSASANQVHASNCVTIGLVNNMPDPALEATERQFIDLIRAAASKTIVRLLLFSIPEIPRADTTRQDMAGRYRDVSELWDAQVDGLIVTGTEPRMKNLKDELYWATLSQVVDWARDHTASTIWSCLAAHAAVLHVDGVERRPLADKLFGVFDCEPAASHPMTRDATICRKRRWRIAVTASSPARRSPASTCSRGRTRVFTSSCKATRNTRRRRCCANTAATSAASCGASATIIPACRWTISTAQRRRARPRSASARSSIAASISSPGFRLASLTPGCRARGAPPPSASTRSGWNI